MYLSDGKIALSLRIEKVDMTTGMPFIHYNMTMFSDLHFKLHLEGIDISLRRMNDITLYHCRYHIQYPDIIGAIWKVLLLQVFFLVSKIYILMR